MSRSRRRRGFFCRATDMLYRVCILMSSSGLMPRAASTINAKSVVTGRLPFSISLSWVYGMESTSENFFCVIPLDSNSSFRTSPGCVVILFISVARMVGSNLFRANPYSRQDSELDIIFNVWRFNGQRCSILFRVPKQVVSPVKQSVSTCETVYFDLICLSCNFILSPWCSWTGSRIHSPCRLQWMRLGRGG